jgi:hypothetical protein
MRCLFLYPVGVPQETKMQPSSAAPQPQQSPLQSTGSIPNGSGYSYSPDNAGGVNYYLNGTPITNSQYSAGTLGTDTNAIETQAAAAYAAAHPAASNTTANTTGSTGGGTTGGYRPPDYTALANAYLAQFGAQDQGLQNSQNLNQQVANSGQSRLQDSYNVQKGGLDQQLAFGNTNLDQSQKQLDITKANSIRDLGNQLRLSQQGLSNQAGVNGAGDSSAADVINYALGQQGNREASDISQNVTQQQTGLNLQRNQLTGSYEQNKNMLDDWHATQLQSIINTYAQTAQQLEQARTSAQGQKAVDLAYIGKGQAANQAITDMQALQASYNSNLNQLQTAYNNVQAPTAAIGAGLTSAYNVNPIDVNNLSSSSLAANTAQPTVNTASYVDPNIKPTQSTPTL